MARRAFRATIGAPLAEVCHQRFLQHTATLDKEAAIDRLVRHVHLGIVRIRVSEPTGDLLGGPLECQFGGHGCAQCRPCRQATDLRAATSRPRARVSDRRTIPAAAAMPTDFPTHRRCRPPQATTHGAEGRTICQPARDFFALSARQRQPGTAPRSRWHTAGARHDIVHALRHPPECPANRLQRLSVSPPSPDFRFLGSVESPWMEMPHDASRFASCCIDRLNPPAYWRAITHLLMWRNLTSRSDAVHGQSRRTKTRVIRHSPTWRSSAQFLEEIEYEHNRI